LDYPNPLPGLSVVLSDNRSGARARAGKIRWDKLGVCAGADLQRRTQEGRALGPAHRKEQARPGRRLLLGDDERRSAAGLAAAMTAAAAGAIENSWSWDARRGDGAPGHHLLRVAAAP
jgi:hypothetical protein